MKADGYLESIDGLRQQRRFLRFACLGLLALCLLLAIAVLMKRETVVQIPPNLASTGVIQKDTANASVKEAWGAYVASTIGNVTPVTADFVAKQLGPLIAGPAYRPLMKAIADQSKTIKEQHVSVQFSPSSVFYDATHDVVVVSGEYTLRGVRNAGDKRSIRTYEIGIQVRNYRVAITSLDTYTGPWNPRSASR